MGLRVALIGTMYIMALAVNVFVATAPQPVEKRMGMAIPISKRSSLGNPDKAVNITVNAYVMLLRSIESTQTYKLAKSFMVSKLREEHGCSTPCCFDRKAEHEHQGYSIGDVDNELWYGVISVVHHRLLLLGETFPCFSGHAPVNFSQ